MWNLCNLKQHIRQSHGVPWRWPECTWASMADLFPFLCYPVMPLCFLVLWVFNATSDFVSLFIWMAPLDKSISTYLFKVMMCWYLWCIVLSGQNYYSAWWPTHTQALSLNIITHFTIITHLSDYYPAYSHYSVILSVWDRQESNLEIVGISAEMERG